MASLRVIREKLIKATDAAADAERAHKEFRYSDEFIGAKVDLKMARERRKDIRYYNYDFDAADRAINEAHKNLVELDKTEYRLKREAKRLRLNLKGTIKRVASRDWSDEEWDELADAFKRGAAGLHENRLTR